MAWPATAGLANRHLTPVQASASDPEALLLEMETSESHIRVAEAARTRVLRDGEQTQLTTATFEEPDWVGVELEVEAREGEQITAEKVVGMYTSREPALSEPALEAGRDMVRLAGFDELLADHDLRWDELWDLCSLELEDSGGAALTELRLHIYHLLANISEHTRDVDAGVPARGLAGEAYRGHVFWDALFIFPFLNLRLPDLTRNLLRYRYRRLNSARRAASELGYDGALYPWQSGSSGVELTPTVHLNPRSGHWNPDKSRLQRHINAAIAYDVWLYQQATNDVEFLALNGAEMFIEIARFWASLAAYDPARERYVIRGVVGPDEYHDGYPESEAPGVRQQRLHQCDGGVGAVAGRGRPRRAPRAAPRRAIAHARVERRGARAVGGDQSQAVPPLPRRRDHQPVRGLRAAAGARLGGLSSEVREHPAARPHPRGRGRHAERATRPRSRRTC